MSLKILTPEEVSRAIFRTDLHNFTDGRNYTGIFSDREEEELDFNENQFPDFFSSRTKVNLRWHFTENLKKDEEEARHMMNMISFLEDRERGRIPFVQTGYEIEEQFNLMGISWQQRNIIRQGLVQIVNSILRAVDNAYRLHQDRKAWAVSEDGKPPYFPDSKVPDEPNICYGAPLFSQAMYEPDLRPLITLQILSDIEATSRAGLKKTIDRCPDSFIVEPRSSFDP